jgi:hypothetical protein
LKEAVIILVNEINSSKSIDGIWKKADLLSRSFALNMLHVFNLIAKKLNNVFITCYLVESFCTTTELICDGKEIESALELCVLMISQQITHLDNNLFNFNALPYDPLAFPLAFEMLSKCLNQFDSTFHKSIMDLIHWIEIVRQFYPRDVLQMTASERKIDSKLFTANNMNGLANGHSNGGNKRESLSIFDQFSDDHHSAPAVVIKKVNFLKNKNIFKIIFLQQFEIDENLKPVMECICHALKVVTFVMNSSNHPYKLFRNYLEEEDGTQLKANFTGSLQNLLKLKLNMTVFVVMQFIISHQKKTNVLVLPSVFVTQVRNFNFNYFIKFIK